MSYPHQRYSCHIYPCPLTTLPISLKCLSSKKVKRIYLLHTSIYKASKDISIYRPHDLIIAEKSTKSSHMPNQMAQPVLSSHPSSTVIAVQASPAVQTAAQEQLHEKMISDLQEKNLMMVAGEQRIVQHSLEKNVLAMTTHFPLNVKLGNRGKANHAWTHLSLCLPVCPLCSVSKNTNSLTSFLF